jgi:hypothetical protein
MLEPVEIMSGFKNIRFVFRTKCKISTSLNELALWFSAENDVLFVHDIEDHNKSMALAMRDLQSDTSWKIRRLFNPSGEQLLKYAIIKNKSHPAIILNEKYKLTDFFPFFRLK